MEMQTNEPIRTPAPRRRRRSKAQIFKEAYLPTIIMAITIVLVLVFIMGIAVYQISRDFSHIDADRLNMLDDLPEKKEVAR